MYPAGAIAYPFLSKRKDQGLFTEYFCAASKRQGGESPSGKQISALHPDRPYMENLFAAFFYTEPSYAENLSAAVPLSFNGWSTGDIRPPDAPMYFRTLPCAFPA